MYYIVLCEGKTDSVIINHIMHSVGFEYTRYDRKKHRITFPLLKNQSIDYFKKKEDNLIIWNVAGYNNLKDAVGKIEEILVDFQIDSLCIVVDRDFNSDMELKEKITVWFKNGIDIVENKWCDYFYVDSYGIEKRLKFLLNIIPKGKFGAIETLILDSMKNESEDNQILGNRLEEFIENLKEENFKYLRKEREVIKAKLGCFVNIIDPERTFKDIIPMLDEIEWDNQEIIQEHFKELKNYNLETID